MPHPVLAMPMWEGAGNLVRDYSGHGNHGTLVNGAIWGMGPNGRGVKCDENQSSIPRIDLQKTVGDYIFSEGTIICDYQRTVDVSGYFFLWTFDSYTGHAFWADDAAGHPITATFLDTTVWSGTSPTYDAFDGDPHIVALTWSDIQNEENYYVDGKVSLSASTAIDIANLNLTATDSAINGSNYGGPDRASDGIMHFCYIFDSVLTAVQIQTICNNPYFMYQIPEEMYGYSPAVVGAIMNQFQKSNIGADLYNGAIIA
jgi:hypothetical protein